MFQISLRQLLILMAALAVAMVSLVYATEFWQGLVGLIATLALVFAILTAAFDRGPRQVFAIGFAAAMVTYSALIWSGRELTRPYIHNVEQLCSRGELPTTILLNCIYQQLKHAAYIDTATGQVISTGEARRRLAAWGAGPTSAAPVSQTGPELPPEAVFTPIGHYWWALLFGFLGGGFARSVYQRRTKEQATHAQG